MRPAVCPIIRLCPVLLYKNSYNKAICDFMLASRGKNKPPRRVHDRTLVPRSSSSPTFSTCILDNDVLPSSSINHWSQAAEDCSSLNLLRSRLRPYVGDGGGWWWLKVKSVFSFRTPSIITVHFPVNGGTAWYFIVFTAVVLYIFYPTQGPVLLQAR